MKSAARFEDVYELSPMQQGILFHTLYDPVGDLYFEQCIVTLQGALDEARFAQAWQRAAARHAILRTSFHWEGLEKPVQVVHPEATVPIESHDWRGIAPDVQRDRLEAFLQADRKRSFDLSTAPLLRVTLFRTAADLHESVLSFQHLLLDRWSRFLVLKEVLAEYAAGGQRALLPSARPYGEYIAWLQEQDRGAAEDFWRSVLAGFTTPTSLGPDRRPGRSIGVAFEEARLRLSAELTTNLQSFARRNRLTLNTLVQGAWAILSSRYSGEEDVLFGAAVSGRPTSLPDVDSMVGLFINTLPVRISVPAGERVLSWLQGLQAQLLELRQYECSSLVDIQGWSEVPRETPLFESLVVFENVGGDSGSLTAAGPLEVLRVRSVGGATSYPLTLFALPGQQISFQILADRTLFERDALSRMLGHLGTLLEGMAADPEQPLSRLPLVTELERRHLLYEWNQTERASPGGETVSGLFEEQVERTPDAVAVVFGRERLTYGQLNERANRLARYLRKRGVGPEVLVGVYVERSLEMVVALLGILKAGGAYVPLDPSYPQQRVAFMLEDAATPVVVTQESLSGALPKGDLERVRLDADWPEIARESGENLKSEAGPANLAYVIYTSGSTGMPKGVAIEQGGVVNLLVSMQELLGLKHTDVLLAVTTISFDIAALEIYLPLAVGASVAVCPRESAWEGKALLEELRRCGATVMQATPVSWRLLLEAGWQSSELRMVLCGGEALSRDLADRLLERSPSVWNLYGPTETTIWSTAWRVEADGGAVSIGTPLANTQVFNLDSHGVPVPAGLPGELHIGGAGLARGYWNRPELTERAFVERAPDGAIAVRLYRTGDRVRYRSDGKIEYLGRMDQQIKLRGFRIELGEVESALREDPAVRNAVAVVREDDSQGARLVAYVVPNAPEATEPEGSADSPSHLEQLGQWQTVWEELYGQGLDRDPSFNIVGWNSSYTGQPLPAGEMKEWVDRTVERIHSLRPSRVLEIGCGTGLVLLRVAPHCARYIGTDFSASVLNQLEESIRRPDCRLSRVELLAKSADDFEGIPRREFDTVVLNSVVQYFPNVEYLLRVMDGAVEAVSDGGSIFIGDVRNLPLLEAFHLSLELERTPASLPIEELRRRVRRRVIQEEELVLDPGFFLALGRHLPRIEHVEVLPKAGRYDNELNRYRYDVILRIGPLAEAAITPSWLDWGERGLTVKGLRRLLEEQEPSVMGIRDVPNTRVTRHVHALELIESGESPRTVGELRTLLEQSPLAGADPTELWLWSGELPYTVDLSWSSSSPSGAFDAVFRRRDHGSAPVRFPGEGTAGKPKPWRAYANDPSRGGIARKLVPRLRAHLQNKLPDYMVPSAFVVLEALPLTPNGKIDRRALPAPDRTRAPGEGLVLPRTPVESELAEIWKDILKLDRIGIEDSFFELGGHSLLATQLVSRIAESFHVRFPLRRIFEKPTLEGLSLAIAHSLAEAERPESMLRMLAEIQGLSDEEARSQLNLEVGHLVVPPDRIGG